MSTKPSVRSGLLLLAAFVPGMVFAGLEQGLGECASIVDDESRLECFDRLAGSLERPAVPPVVAAPEPEPAPEPAAPVSASTEPAPAAAEARALGDEVGRSVTRTAGGEKKPRETWVAEVDSCDQAVDGKMLFFFENGQIWKQSKSRRVSIEDCSVEATLTKDMFGFKMSLAGYDRTVRVRRIR